jgi:hypothetical protein
MQTGLRVDRFIAHQGITKMNLEESRALAQFCADQYFAFDARAWKRRSQYDHHASTIAALYLAMSTWYGHETELERIAADAGALNAGGEALRRPDQGSFDADQFSAMVRAEIARRRIPAPAARANRQPRSAAA